MDLLIRGGTVVDGTGAPPVVADLLVDRDRIAGIGSFPDVTARTVWDAGGLSVTPGFIDGHTHSDLALLVNRQHPHAVYSGISTLVVGQCGLGFAPMAPGAWDASIRMHAGIFGDPRPMLPRWEGFGAYLCLLDGCAVNVGACVTHNAIRQAGTGFGDGPLEGPCLDRALEALECALDEGALGLSLGLSYYPGSFGDTRELVALCKVVAAKKALLCVHARLNPLAPDFDPLVEMARVVEETGVRLHMLHHRTRPPATVGHVERILAPFEHLLEAGARISFEYYPYLAGAGYALVFLPGWVQEGGPDAIVERLAAPGLRQALLRDIGERYPSILRPGIRGIVSAARDPYAPELGRSFEDIAAERGLSVPETIVELLLENDLNLGFHETEPEDPALCGQLFDDQFAMFTHPRYTMGSDTIPYGEYCHPRVFGAFPRLLRQMLDRGMPVQTLVHKLTAFPATLYGLGDRGILAPGKQADICLWNPATVGDTSRYGRPRTRPTGMDGLVVGGKPVLWEGAITGLLPGKSLKRQHTAEMDAKE